MLVNKGIESPVCLCVEMLSPIADFALPHEMTFLFVSQAEIVPVRVVHRRVLSHPVEVSVRRYQTNLRECIEL